jgi:hypothetical protein
MRRDAGGLVASLETDSVTGLQSAKPRLILKWVRTLEYESNNQGSIF